MNDVQYCFDKDSLTDCDSDNCSSVSDTSEDKNYHSEDESLENLEEDDLWYHEPLFEHSNTTVGQAVLDVLEIFIQNKNSKKSLGHMLRVFHKHLPKPNRMPKSQWFLLQLLNKLFPNNVEMVEKYRICEDCSHLLGKWYIKRQDLIYDACKSNNTDGVFYEFNLALLLKTLFENRNLGDLIVSHENESSCDKNYVSGITSGSQYKIWKEEVIKNKFDSCLLWNTDGTPLKESSNANMWLIQCQIINIPRQCRRNFQFATGIFYNINKKPVMNCFFSPFVNSLKFLYTDGINWFNKKSQKMENSRVIAPIATCDAPARSEVQNLMYPNGEFGCFSCEVRGQTSQIGTGHNTVFIIDPQNLPARRTKERMYEQAKKCVVENLNHEMGVKGPSLVSLIFET